LGHLAGDGTPQKWGGASKGEKPTADDIQKKKEEGNQRKEKEVPKARKRHNKKMFRQSHAAHTWRGIKYQMVVVLTTAGKKGRRKKFSTSACRKGTKKNIYVDGTRGGGQEEKTEDDKVAKQKGMATIGRERHWKKKDIFCLVKRSQNELLCPNVQ